MEWFVEILFADGSKDKTDFEDEDKARLFASVAMQKVTQCLLEDDRHIVGVSLGKYEEKGE